MHKTKSGNISEPVDSVGEALLIPLPVYTQSKNGCQINILLSEFK